MLALACGTNAASQILRIAMLPKQRNIAIYGRAVLLFCACTDSDAPGFARQHVKLMINWFFSWLERRVDSFPLDHPQMPDVVAAFAEFHARHVTAAQMAFHFFMRVVQQHHAACAHVRLQF